MVATQRPTCRDCPAPAAAGFVSAPALACASTADRRGLALDHLDTGESLDVLDWAEGHYLPVASRRIGELLRDPLRVEELHPVICGYRSPATNAALRAETQGVAAGSLHRVGRAIDGCVPGIALATVYRVAAAMKGRRRLRSTFQLRPYRCRNRPSLAGMRE